MRLPLTFLILTIFTTNLCKSQRPSPCPEIFHYESQNRDEENKWFGIITLRTNEDLYGVWVKITLDHKALRLGNWFGASTSSDDKEFTIKSTNYHLQAGNPVQLRFYIEYESNQLIPSVSAIKLNGKIICNETQNRPRPSNTKPAQSSQHRPLNVDADSYGNKEQSELNPAFGNNRPTGTQQHGSRPQQNSVSKPATSRPTSRPNNSQSNHQQTQTSSTRPNYQNNEYDSRPTQSNRPIYQNEYETVASGTNRPGNGGGSNVNRPLTVDSDSYGTNQNEFAPAFGNIGENSQFGQSSTNNNNNRLPTDNYNTNRPSGTTNLGSSSTGINQQQRPSTTHNSEPDFFPGDITYASSKPAISKPQTARPTVLLNQKPACGTVFSKPTPLITHGLESHEGQYPWHVALYHSQGIQLSYICGGSLISEDYVVTAAHCVTNPSTGRATNPQNILVYLGKTNLKKFGTEIQDRDVSKIIVHNDYNHTVFHNDIALLKLGSSADITNYVRPVCLWEGNTDLNGVLDQLGTVVGWGFDENGQLTTSLMETKLPIVSSIKCVYSNPDFFSRFTFDKSYCAGFRNGTTVCNGDSGGGMVFPKTKRNGEVLSWHLRGLVSVGVALQGKTSCDPSHYIVFTDVAKHLDWIRNNINNNNDYY